MDFEKTYLDLEPLIRSHALVGAYMGYYAAMECEINDMIQECFKLSGADALIICTNLNYHSKIKILKTLNDTYSGNEDARKIVERNLTKVGDLSKDRNMIAHTPFVPSKKTGGGITLLRTSASKKINIAPIEWSIKDIEKKCSKLFQAAKFIRELSPQLAEVAADTREISKQFLADPSGQE